MEAAKSSPVRPPSLLATEGDSGRFLARARGAPKQHATIGIMHVEKVTESSEPAPSQTPAGDWINRAIQSGRMLSSKEVASMLGYRSRCSFWGWVRKAQPPHVRLSARNIRFPAAALKAWLDTKSNFKGVL